MTNSLWSVTESDEFEARGRSLAFQHGSKVRARLVFGAPHAKAFLHVYSADGVPLTHPGVDAAGVPFGEFPRLRGFSIGWSRVSSDLRCDDFWHAGGPATMVPMGWHMIPAPPTKLVVAVEIAWRGGNAAEAQPLIDETRTIGLETTAQGALRIDTTFELRARRDLVLDGDAHHGGVQFRAAAGLTEHPRDVHYSWSPDAAPGEGVVAGAPRDWIRLGFRLGEANHSCLLMNDPANPLEEIAWRNYGRFGFFFRCGLAVGSALRLRYRLVISEENSCGADGAMQRARCNREHEAFVAESRG